MTNGTPSDASEPAELSQEPDVGFSDEPPPPAEFLVPYASDAVEPFGSRATFCGVPVRAVNHVRRGEVVVLGAPFDWGTSFRPGARFGPRAIRDADYLEPDGKRPHLATGIDPLTELPVVDAGDAPVFRGYIERSLDSIERYAGAVAVRGGVPVTLGGDHSITFATATAAAKVYGFGNVALVHFDAHADTGVYSDPSMMGHGAPMRRLIESGAIPGHRFVQIGLRGYWPDPATVQWMREQGMRSYFMSELVERGLRTVIDEAIEAVLAGDGKSRAKVVFLSVDIDVVDPGLAPGTGTPEPGGMTSRQLLDSVREICASLPICGIDVVEVAPHYDQPSNVTAMLANRAVLECLTGIAQHRRAGGAPLPQTEGLE